MSATRAFALRSAFRTACRPVRTQMTSTAAGRRGYASVHDAANKSSDMPWLIGALTIGGGGSAWLIYSRPARMDYSHDEHLAYASDEHGVEHEKPAHKINKDDEGVPRGETPAPTSGGQTGDDESKGPMSDKKDVSIPKAVEEDMTEKDSDTIQKEKDSSDGEGKSGPSASAEEEGKPAKDDRSEKTSGKKTEGGNDTDEKKGKDDSDKQKEQKEKNEAKDSKKSGDDAKKKQAGSDGKEKPANSEGKGNTEMDDDSESQAKKLSEKEPTKRVDPTSK